MVENYGGGLGGHAMSYGSFGGGRDGMLRNGVRFDVVCNCPGTAPQWRTTDQGLPGQGGADDVLHSSAWISAVTAGMLDQLVFIDEGNRRSDAVMERFAREAHELAPSYRGEFGAHPTPLSVSHTIDAVACQRPRAVDTEDTLRVAAWEEPAAAPATFCAHVIAVNADASSPRLFSFTLHGSEPPITANASMAVQAYRLFGAGAAVNVTPPGGGSWQAATDWIAPAATNIYRIGCEPPPAQPTNLATNPSFELPALSPAWGQGSYGGDDPRVMMLTDTAVAVDGRHSLRVVVPSVKPLVLPLPGKQLVPNPTAASWGSTDVPAVGTHVFGRSVTLLAGHTYDVSLSVQASPAGTTVELLDGYWTVQNGSTVREAEPDIKAAYVQRSVLGSVVGNQSWQLLAAQVAVPAATAGRNGTALQLRITALGNARGWGGSTWLDKVVIRDSLPRSSGTVTHSSTVLLVS